MWADGTIRPHKVDRIVRTGRKFVYRVRCESGRQIRATADHRLLTTEGYLEIEGMEVGRTELITMPMISENQREARRQTMTRLAHSAKRAEWDRRASIRMKAYQDSRPYEEKAAHMRRMHELYPDMKRIGIAAMQERNRWLWANDPEWRKRKMENSLRQVRAAYDTGPGYGHCSSCVQRYVVCQLAGAGDGRVSDRARDRIRDAQAAYQRAHVRLLLRRRVLGDGRARSCP